MLKPFFITLFVFSFLLTNAQKEYQRPDFGFGTGLNYGGYGINVAGSPIKYLSFSIFGGYNLVKFNAGVGTSLFFRSPDKLFRPNIKLIYGSNAAIAGRNYTYYLHINKNGTCYFGPSAGLGLSWKFQEGSIYGLDLDILYPFHSEKFKKDLKRADIEDQKIYPKYKIAISLSLHFWNINKSEQ